VQRGLIIDELCAAAALLAGLISSQSLQQVQINQAACKVGGVYLICAHMQATAAAVASASPAIC
jgi:hypothetical protein